MLVFNSKHPVFQFSYIGWVHLPNPFIMSICQDNLIIDVSGDCTNVIFVFFHICYVQVTYSDGCINMFPSDTVSVNLTLRMAISKCLQSTFEMKVYSHLHCSYNWYHSMNEQLWDKTEVSYDATLVTDFIQLMVMGLIAG